MTHYDLVTCDNPACDAEKRLADGARSAAREDQFARSGLVITWGALTNHACSVDCLVAVAAEMQREQRHRSRLDIENLDPAMHTAQRERQDHEFH